MTQNYKLEICCRTAFTLFWLQVLLLLRQLSNLFLAPVQSFKIIKPCALAYLVYPSAESFIAETSKIWISTYSLNICCPYCFIIRGTRSPIYRNFDKAFLFIGSRISVFRLYTSHLFLNVWVSLKSDCFGICTTCRLRALQNVLDFLQVCSNLLFISCQPSAQTSLFSHMQPG